MSILTSLPLVLGLGPATPPERPLVPTERQETAATAPIPAKDLELERRLAARVSDVRARDMVRAFVSLGPRMGGTASGERSVRLLEATFEDIGLPTRRHAARKAWCHEETAWSVALSIDGAEAAPVERIWPRGFSPSGGGRHVLSLETSEDTALLATGYRGTRRRGVPPAVVLDDGSTTHDGAWPICRPHPLGRRAKAPVFGISKGLGDTLRAALGAGSEVQVEWSLTSVITEASPITVVASLAPREGALPGHVLVCAHGDSDSGGPGANDNGSGIAILLEIARAWRAAVALGDVPAPPVEVRFAVWGKEIHSTSDYLRSDLGADVLAVLNFDQAGYGTTGQRLHVEPDDLPANEAFVRLAAEALADHGDQPGFPARWATNKSLGGTDSYVFSGNKRFRTEGLPSVTLFTSAWGQPDEQPRTKGMPGESWTDRERVTMDYDLHYHSAGDTPENTTDLEPENMGWCARIGLVTMLRWTEEIARR